MGENILIASLGESPVVVTAMFDLLTTEEKERELGKIKKVVVLRPAEDDTPVSFGYTLIEEALEGQCELIPEPLPFEDANGAQESIYFLQRLYQLLSYHQGCGNTVFLSLAGGRKNMSALMALLAPFFPCVKKLYHVLDRDENKRKHQFKSIAELFNLSRDDQKLYMHPELDRLTLVDIPYGEKQRLSPELRTRLFTITAEQLDELWDENPTLAGVAQFLRPLSTQAAKTSTSQSDSTGRILEIFVTEHVKKQYELMEHEDRPRAQEFAQCFEQMHYAERLANKELHLHDYVSGVSPEGKSVLFHYYKRRRTIERPFYYTWPEGIHRYPHTDVRRVIVCDLVKEVGQGVDNVYEPSKKESLKSAEQPTALYPLGELLSIESILLVPLGVLPMIATQLYTLLSVQGLRIREVVLIYPGGSQVVCNSAGLVKEALEGKGVALRDVPIKNLEDIKSTQDCLDYEKALENIIDLVHKEHPECEIELALSGGRKGMAALAMFVAQRKGIRYLYHTIINDDKLEERVLDETSVEALNKIGKAERRERLFLRTYNGEGINTKFALFRVPVVPAGVK